MQVEDWASQRQHAVFRDDAGRANGTAFLRGVAKACPHAVHADEPHPQGPRIWAFRCPGLESLKTYTPAFVSAHSLAKQLKAFRWRTPFEAVYRAWTTTPDVLKRDPRHLIPGLNS